MKKTFKKYLYIAKITVTKWPKYLLQKPYAIKFYYPWLKMIMLNTERTITKNQIPWIPFEARVWLDKFLDKKMRIFEWGSGGSTLYIAPKVKKITSVEHDKEWYQRVSQLLRLKNISNCDCFLEEPTGTSTKTTEIPGNYKSSSEKYKDQSFYNYCTKITTYPDKHFHLILVDGRARVSCLNLAISKLHPDGYILIDNSERDEYIQAIEGIPCIFKKNIFGPGPYTIGFWQATILRPCYPK